MLTITQSLPIQNMASLTISLDISSMPTEMETLLKLIAASPGSENPHLVAME